ncbi:hypothetical protein SPRG_13618 [Saprolegnia parasitica CBS 223.65]|uniref:Uncharacterized protein n=1 Tax=Saprolegnia parasitica (strain CBS 223.65) TaxID=695850 RepID=A0A067C1Y0_SAPPC|nr:hypothetical protein SPRG_13618 [Saprolegnia parasitica CBS 223.65]KDO20802.1 hypothetical protein SPRG_13618 [Saprolegnia parasitica CBS 223.65]|eukprot:XP_012208461.1 hypothetical protein SPRG_13618 [Saprolegnia parasitica CBS 223.65]
MQLPPPTSRQPIGTLECFFADHDLADEAVVWFCVDTNQRVPLVQSFEPWALTFKTSLAAIGNVVMTLHPWNDPIVLRRSWCVVEVYVAATLGASFEIALAWYHKAQFLKDIGCELNAFRGMLATIKNEASETTVPRNRDGS